MASGLTIVCLVLFAFAVPLLIHGGRFSESNASHFGYSGLIALGPLLFRVPPVFGSAPTGGRGARSLTLFSPRSSTLFWSRT